MRFQVFRSRAPKHHSRLVAVIIVLSLCLIPVRISGQTEGKNKAAAEQQSQPKPKSAEGPAEESEQTAESLNEAFVRDKNLHDQAMAYVREFMRIDISVLAPMNVADIFGRHIAHRYVALQVIVKNDNPKFRFLIQDIKMNFDGIYADRAFIPKVLDPTTPPLLGKSKGKYRPSSNDLTLVQGVAERGQNYDRRNFTLRILRGAGSVAAGLIGVTTFGSSYAPSVAVFNGPVISAFASIFPDSTINQLIRLNNQAFRTNSLVPAQQSIPVVVFLDLALLVPDPNLRKKFYNDPLSISDKIDFRGSIAIVNGTFITDAFEESVSVTQAFVAADQLVHFQDPKPKVQGRIIGRGLVGATLDLDSPQPKGVKVELNGTPEATKIEFTITSENPLPPDTPLRFVVIKNQQVLHTSLNVNYTMDNPTLTAITPAEGEVGKTVSVVLKGEGFNGFSKITFDTPGVTAEITEVKDKTINADFAIAADAKPGDIPVRVENQGSRTPPKSFKVKEPEPKPEEAAEKKKEDGKKKKPAKKPKPKPQG